MSEKAVIYKSPIGEILLKEQSGYLTGLFFERETTLEVFETPILTKTMKQLDEYFEGKRKNFDLELNNIGTDFRKKTWDALMKIPYGETINYKELAIMIGNEKAARAVGGANHHNNISIIVPCHRVIGASGKLVGYGGEVWRKEWLLEHEKKHK
ncbi:MAG: methylated-DNA--[protein]-cysteine S-methyltransferase [Defluviitaleaceae bacterium]|nr:methylated-DNA--[protein]-cysteine S-methyltransferase [Defluviitaleaceae bacterium]